MNPPTYFLVDPGINPKLYNATALQPTYAQLFSHLNEVGEVIVLSNRLGKFQDIDFTVIPGLADLWVRDIGVIETKEGVFAPRYSPGYLRKEEAYLQGGVEEFRKMFWPDAKPLDLILETGNFVSDGRVAILCDKVLTDNRLDKDGLLRKLEPLGLEEIVLLPTDPKDPIGHSDGLVAYFGKGKLLCSLDPVCFPASKEKDVTRAILELERHFDVLHIPPTYPDEPGLSAVGCYANLLNLPDRLLVPQYHLPKDSIVIETLADFVDKPVIGIPSRELAEYGGVLHCATFDSTTVNTTEKP